MRALVFANGEMNENPEGLGIVSSRDLIVVADGGLSHCRKMGLIPNVLVGDMDSLVESDLRPMKESNVEIVVRPRRKDETDLEMALRVAIGRGADRIAVVGALGARWDMTFCNLLLLGAAFLDDIDVKILDGRTEISRVKGGQTVEFAGVPGDRLSIVPLAGDADGVTLEGLEYPLKKEGLPFGSTRGLSNVFEDKVAKVSLERGLIAVLTTRGKDRHVARRTRSNTLSFD